MNTMKIKVICPILLLLIVGMNSCKKEFPNDPLSVMDLSVNGCKTKGGLSDGIAPEYLTIKTVDDYYILVNHINAMFNCEPGQITVTIDASSNEISMDENESSSLVDCICPYDIIFKLGPLPYGTYILKFKRGGLTFKEYTLNFKKSTDIKIDLSITLH
jgi:hypothetical protein